MQKEHIGANSARVASARMMAGWGPDWHEWLQHVAGEPAEGNKERARSNCLESVTKRPKPSLGAVKRLPSRTAVLEDPSKPSLTQCTASTFPTPLFHPPSYLLHLSVCCIPTAVVRRCSTSTSIARRGFPHECARLDSVRPLEASK